MHLELRMFSIKSPSTQRIVAFQLVFYLLSGSFAFLFDRDFGSELLYAGIFFLLNLFLWISLVKKLVFLLSRKQKSISTPSREDLLVEGNEITSGGISLVVLFIFLLKMGLLSVICVLAMRVVSGISIIFSNTIIVLSLLFSSIRVNL